MSHLGFRCISMCLGSVEAGIEVQDIPKVLRKFAALTTACRIISSTNGAMARTHAVFESLALTVRLTALVPVVRRSSLNQRNPRDR